MILPMLPDLAANLVISLAPGLNYVPSDSNHIYMLIFPARFSFVFKCLRNCQSEQVSPSQALTFFFLFFCGWVCSCLLVWNDCRRWCSLFVTMFMKFAMIALVSCSEMSILCPSPTHCHSSSQVPMSLFFQEQLFDFYLLVPCSYLVSLDTSRYGCICRWSSMISRCLHSLSSRFVQNRRCISGNLHDNDVCGCFSDIFQSRIHHSLSDFSIYSVCAASA